MISQPLQFDPDWRGQLEGLTSNNTPPPHITLTHPPHIPLFCEPRQKKPSHVHPGGGGKQRVFTDHFCSIKLQAEVLPYLSTKVVNPGGGMLPKLKTGTSKKQVSLLVWQCNPQR